MTPRTCPNCREVIPTESGFYFDKDFNLICGNCGEIAFPATNDPSKHPYFPQNGAGLLNDKWSQDKYSGVKNLTSEEPDDGE